MKRGKGMFQVTKEQFLQLYILYVEITYVFDGPSENNVSLQQNSQILLIMSDRTVRFRELWRNEASLRNACEWGDMFICRLLFHYKKNPTMPVCLIQSETPHDLIENQLVLDMIQLKNCTGTCGQDPMIPPFFYIFFRYRFLFI